MKKIGLIILLFIVSLLSFGQKEDVKDTVKEKEFKGILDSYINQYSKFCYNDSSKINCYVILLSDGVNSRYDTVCNKDLIMFYMNGSVPIPMKIKYDYYFHKNPDQSGFIDWLMKNVYARKEKK